jgi:hypothetical protein
MIFTIVEPTIFTKKSKVVIFTLYYFCERSSCFGGIAAAFPTFKVSAQKGLF